MAALAFLHPTAVASFRLSLPRSIHRLSKCGPAPGHALHRRACIVTSSATDAPSPSHSSIQLMACDMDGTLLTTDKRVSRRTTEALLRLFKETDILFFPATGKSRGGALRGMGVAGDVLQSRYPAGCPGVYLQGLIAYDIEGAIIYENKLDNLLAHQTVEIARQLDVDLIAYSRDVIFTEQRTPCTDVLPDYHEPLATEIGKWENVIGNSSLNKMILMAPPSRIDAIRPLVQQKVGHIAHLTQAQSDMLEVLPPNSSKGDGVRRLLAHLGVLPENVLAVGDAENDLELLEMVRFSCAVANALPSVKAVANYTDFSSNDDDGVAEVIHRFLLPSAVSK